MTDAEWDPMEFYIRCNGPLDHRVRALAAEAERRGMLRAAGIVQMNSHDWTGDASHENGNYENRCIHCGHTFYGHKRRIECRYCVDTALRAAAIEREAGK